MLLQENSICFNYENDNFGIVNEAKTNKMMNLPRASC